MQTTGQSTSQVKTILDTKFILSTKLIEEISLVLDSSNPSGSTWYLNTEQSSPTDMKLTMLWEFTPQGSLQMSSSFALSTKTFYNSKDSTTTLIGENLSVLVDSKACEHFMNSYWSEIRQTTFADVPESVKLRLRNYLKDVTTSPVFVSVYGKLSKEPEQEKTNS